VSINSKDATSLTGLDWRSRLKEVVLDALVWQKLIQYYRNSDETLRPAANKNFQSSTPRTVPARSYYFLNRLRRDDKPPACDYFWLA